jgi:hypothetical protein
MVLSGKSIAVLGVWGVWVAHIRPFFFKYCRALSVQRVVGHKDYLWVLVIVLGSSGG